MLTGELKAICIKELQEFVGGFQERRKAVTEETINLFMSTRPLVWGQGKAAAAAAAPQEDGLKAKVDEVTQKVKDAVIS